MKRILIQLDTDSQASSFDAVTAIDAGVDHLLSYSQINPSNIVPLVQGAIFTRGSKELKNTAIFVGGSNVEAGEKVLAKVQESFFGSMRVSVMMDSNGCNTTAAAAVYYAKKQLDLSQSRAVVLGGTGPVGRRSAHILGSLGAEVVVVSRSLSKAEHVCSLIDDTTGRFTAAEIPAQGKIGSLLEGADLVIAAGAAGVQFATLDELSACESLKVVIDLNAVPPLGIGGIQSTDKANQIGSLICYGALGVGGLKMKIHHHLIEQLFESNDQVFDTSQIYNAALNMG
ncbi:MAG: bifunctional NADP-dependent methylenetetrahydromethanopterin dehydrogenase/methylenetetrahydrofolate dehydrogenase [Planctomycetaceae bacterium]|nr:bifunctional NADP-dependent methylenetetrahydromethanopterin dehydrogenase/methylenetetrahydrofolate dehydrogenase [Planctomycetaceae bacterium]